jgi:hypothetical protein
LCANIPRSYVPSYLAYKYFPFSREFEEKYKLPVDSLLSFSLGVNEFLNFKKNYLMFNDEVYAFSSKDEYIDLGFVAQPDDEYVTLWKNIITINRSEIERVLSTVLNPEQIQRVLDILSIDLNSPNIHSDDIDFTFTPFIKLDNDTFVLMIESYLIRSLPFVYEKLFKNVKTYNDIKGKTFEFFVYDTLKALPFEGLNYNIFYGKKYEVDAICEFSKSIWFVEITSHPPSIKSLKGHPLSIENDLKKALNKCLNQGERTISYLNSDELKYWGNKAKLKGILIVVDGVYPQLNMNTINKLFDTNTRVYIINWFDLMTFIDQPELIKIEDFLIWRTEQPMPIMSFDEKDYWGFYFDRYLTMPEMRDKFPEMRKKDFKVIYTSPRFTNKQHLRKIARQIKPKNTINSFVDK